MFYRLFRPPQKQSFFLFGPRGTGKSTLIRKYFPPSGDVLYIDLLEASEEDAFQRDPGELSKRVAAMNPAPHWVVIDEVQKEPRLLDVVHKEIETQGRLFALTGSSARKLKRGGANLLAGRAFVHHLYPLTHRELGEAFDLDAALHWGTLPKVIEIESPGEKMEFLRAYGLTYLKEEIAAEQIVRNLRPFRSFLEVAAQCNGQIINYSAIAREIQADVKTVQGYFEILEDTLVGFLLPPYHESFRKRQRHNPKFYFFDPGAKRALDRTLTQSFGPGTYAFGNAFEHFVILEVYRLASYARLDWRCSYLRTKDNAEIDLVLERPGMSNALVEIKSKERISDQDVAALNRFARDIPKSEAFCLSRDPVKKRIQAVLCLPWQDGLRELGLEVG